MKGTVAIDTIYRGYRFRSRLEARWAVFFDALGLKWDYEPEGFELGRGKRYLPDFRVEYPDGGGESPDSPWWFEVKPSISHLTQGELERLLLFSKSVDHRLVLLDGTPGMRMYGAPSQGLEAKHDRDGYALWSSKERPWWDIYADFFLAPWNLLVIEQLTCAVCRARGARFEFEETSVGA